MKVRLAIATLLPLLFIPMSGLCESRVGPRLKEYFKDAFLPHMWDDTKHVFAEPKNWLFFGAGGALTVAAHQYDWDVNDYWKDHRQPYGLSDFGNDYWGRGELQGGLALSMMLAGWQFDNEKAADAGEVLAEAQIIQGVVINVIKPLAGKERPDGSDNLSFPSGHTGTAFCTAAVLQDRYGWKLGAPAYTAAVITAMSRMDVNRHWLSDTVMGATIAMVTGYAVSRTHDDYPYDVRWHKPKQPAMLITPSIGPNGYGLTVSAAW